MSAIIKRLPFLYSLFIITVFKSKHTAAAAVLLHFRNVTDYILHGVIGQPIVGINGEEVFTLRQLHGGVVRHIFAAVLLMVVAYLYLPLPYPFLHEESGVVGGAVVNDQPLEIT